MQHRERSEDDGAGGGQWGAEAVSADAGDGVGWQSRGGTEAEEVATRASALSEGRAASLHSVPCTAECAAAGGRHQRQMLSLMWPSGRYPLAPPRGSVHSLSCRS